MCRSHTLFHLYSQLSLAFNTVASACLNENLHPHQAFPAFPAAPALFGL